jgi:DNA replication and repair protein RecF
VHVETIIARGVRNLAPLELTPRARFNVFVGDNGQGKTNLLETVFVVATLRSFRTSKLSELLAFGAAEATIGARVVRDGLTRIYEVTLAPGSRKVRLDGKVPRPLGHYFGAFNVVVFTPDDLQLPRGAPGDRRRFLDRAVFNRDPAHLGVVQDFDKVLKTRNTVLRNAAAGTMPRGQVDALLDVYDQQLARLGVALATSRRRVVDELAGRLAAAFAAITRTGLTAAARYVTTWADADVAEVEQRLRAGRPRDLGSQSTQQGPHRDDLAFELEGREAGSFASQGQLRAILLAWKTAELELLGQVHGDPPILLLDDVSSELDPDRNAYLFEHLAGLAGQCFITTTAAHHVLLTADRADYAVRNGVIS